MRLDLPATRFGSGPSRRIWTAPAWSSRRSIRAAYVEVIGPAGVVKREHRSRIGAATRLRPEVDDPSSAAATEDDLDAAITAVALLRRLRADMPLANEATVDRRAEGGILCV